MVKTKKDSVHTQSFSDTKVDLGGVKNLSHYFKRGESLDEEIILICECCWKPIEGQPYTVDEVTMCEECFIYHYGEDY